MTTNEKQQFDAWFAEQYDNIKSELMFNGSFDEDVFHDTYLRLSDALTPENDINIYRRLVDAMYANLRKNKLWQSFLTVNPQEIFFDLLKDEAEGEEEETETAAPVITGYLVKSYARGALTTELYQVFILRYEQDMTYQQIGAYLGKGKDFAKSQSLIACNSIRKHFNQLAAI